MKRGILTFVAVIAMTGCTPYQSPAEKLDISIHAYNTAVRWRNYQVAAKHVPQTERQQYLSTRRRLNNDMRILDFEINEVRQVETNKRAEVRVHFTWTQLASNLVEHTHFKQTWKYGEEKKWLLAGQVVVEAPERKPKKVPLRDRF